MKGIFCNKRYTQLIYALEGLPQPKLETVYCCCDQCYNDVIVALFGELNEHIVNQVRKT